jgi:hypothetical protein
MRQCGACLALLALTLQLALSFGHIHAQDLHIQDFHIQDFHSQYLAGRDTHRATADAASAWRRPIKARAEARLPTKLADDDENCPICFSGFLLATSFIPDAMQPSTSPDFTDARRSLPPAFDGVLKTHRAPFQSRAPPPG